MLFFLEAIAMVWPGQGAPPRVAIHLSDVRRTTLPRATATRVPIRSRRSASEAGSAMACWRSARPWWPRSITPAPR